MKKLLCLLLAVVMTATMLAGCETQNSGTEKNANENESKKEKVTVALWGIQLLENYAEYLCDTFPEVEFEFVLATNSIDYYRYRNDHDDLPDILTVRRFSLKDAVLIKDLLYDLCDTELASTFYGTYLDNYTYDDGTINWLPACADVDSIIINETLFKENNIPIPTDYDSFIAACEAFEELGIQGFASDFGSDYTCMEVLQGFSISQLLSMEGQSSITYGKNMIPYNKDVTLELLPELDNIKPYIDQNKMYIRLASNEMFSISQNVVQRILLGELNTPKEAFEAFNALMTESKPSDDVAAHIDTAYSNQFTAEHGNLAASAVYNTVRAEAGVDMVFGQSCYVSSDIYEGDYTEKDLGYLINNDVGNPVIAQLTGEQLFNLVQYTLSLKGNRGAVSNDSTLYVSSGFEMDISRTDSGYKLNALTVDGEELDPNAKYSVLVCSDYDWYVVDALKAAGCEDYESDDVHFETYVLKRLAEEGGQLEEPADYITLR